MSHSLESVRSVLPSVAHKLDAKPLPQPTQLIRRQRIKPSAHPTLFLDGEHQRNDTTPMMGVR